MIIVASIPASQRSVGGRLTMRPSQAGFTLTELLVTIVIIAILAALTLSGLATARQRVKIDRTKNTIRKIHDVVMPQYESYARRRVPAVLVGNGAPPSFVGEIYMAYVDRPTATFYGPKTSAGWPMGGVAGTDTALVVARSRLQMLRLIQVFEMPDSWGDVAKPILGQNVVRAVEAFCPSYARTGPVLSYAAVWQNLPLATQSTVGSTNGSAECLYLIVACGGFEPDVMEQFRGDEIGDTDDDGAPEFLDAWGRPIQFIRWAPGISSGPRPSPIQKPDPIASHDPVDLMRVDPNGYALVPLIYSEGPDGVTGSLVDSGQGTRVDVLAGQSLITVTSGSYGDTRNGLSAAVADNISNPDLMAK